MNVDLIQSQLRASWGEAATLVPRRPGRIYQIDLPAFLGDGDGVFIFVVPGPEATVRLSDLGQTTLRLSYTRRITPQVTSTLGRLADRHGLKLEDGRLFVDVPANEFLAGILALIQVQTAAETAITAAIRRSVSAENFKAIVREAIQEAFAGMVEFDLSDSERLYSIDAVVRGPGASVGLAVVPSDLEAERAVVSKLKLAELQVPALPRHWVALPRDINALSDKTRAHLMKEFLAPMPVFEAEREALREKVMSLAA